MTIWLWFLIIEDIILVGGSSAMLYLRQRPYVIAGSTLLGITVVSNILFFSGPRNVFFALLPMFTLLLLAVVGRSYLPPPRVTLSRKAAEALLLFLIFAILILLVLAILPIFLHFG